MKEIEFHPATLKVIKKFPSSVKKELGKAMRDLQKGHKLTLPISRTMKQVGKGVDELRVKDSSGAYRVFYLARLEDKIYIFHAFKKKTQKTPNKDIVIGKKRLKELLDG